MRRDPEGAYEKLVARGADALGEVLFPVNDLAAPNWKESDVVGRLLSYTDELPLRMRRLVRLQYAAMQVFGGLLALRPWPFGRLAVKTRHAAFVRMRNSPVLALRLLSDALKASLQMMYFSDPAVQKVMGAFKPETRPDDPFQIEVREGVLEAHLEADRARGNAGAAPSAEVVSS